MFSGELEITIAIPFDGDRHLFICRPSTYKPTPPSGDIAMSEIRLQYRTDDRNTDSIKKDYNNDINRIKEYLPWIQKDLDAHNEWIKSNAKKLISKRKNDLLRDQAFLESLDMPIKRTESITETFSIPLTRKKIEVSRPQSGTTVLQKPDPALSETDYEYILETICHMSVAMERSPKTFLKLCEPEIRDFFVIVLNSHYEGHATGETFNYNGKTDILVRVGDDNIFIAECKFWNGEKTLVSTIDQILRYTTWRDTKTAIFLFNRNQNFSSVLHKIENTVSSHKFYKRKNELRCEKIKKETMFSYVFGHPTDIERELLLTILAFDISPSVV